MIPSFARSLILFPLYDTDYDATIIGVPFDGGCTFRSGTRFGPQGIRRISALYTPYNYEMGIDLREQMSLCDAGDVFTIPANIEKTFDQVSSSVECRHLACRYSDDIICNEITYMNL